MPQDKKMLNQLLLAKKMSDSEDYVSKYNLMNKLLKDHPDEFYVDQDHPEYPGIVHAPTGFRMHLPRQATYGIEKKSKSEPTAEDLMKRPCCGSGCTNCPYSPKHKKGNTKVREELKKEAKIVKDKKSGKWILYTKDGSRILGKHENAQDAYKQEYAIEKSMQKRSAFIIPNYFIKRSSEETLLDKLLPSAPPTETPKINQPTPKDEHSLLSKSLYALGGTLGGGIAGIRVGDSFNDKQNKAFDRYYDRYSRFVKKYEDMINEPYTSTGNWSRRAHLEEAIHASPPMRKLERLRSKNMKLGVALSAVIDKRVNTGLRIGALLGLGTGVAAPSLIEKFKEKDNTIKQASDGLVKVAAKWDKVFKNLSPQAKLRITENALPGSEVPDLEIKNLLNSLRTANDKSTSNYLRKYDGKALNIFRQGLKPKDNPSWYPALKDYKASGGGEWEYPSIIDKRTLDANFNPTNYKLSNAWTYLPGAQGSGRYEGKTGELFTDIVHHPKASRQANELKKAITAHEEGHAWTYNDPNSANLAIKSFINSAKKTLPDHISIGNDPKIPANWSFDSKGKILSEIAAHWRATKDNRNAIRFPLLKMKKQNPEILKKWDSDLPDNLSEQARRRILAVRSHLFQNYLID